MSLLLLPIQFSRGYASLTLPRLSRYGDSLVFHAFSIAAVPVHVIIFLDGEPRQHLVLGTKYQAIVVFLGQMGKPHVVVAGEVREHFPGLFP